jgi:hypothetical protein
LLGDLGVVPGGTQHNYLVVQALDNGTLFSVDDNTVPHGATGNDASDGQVTALRDRKLAGTLFSRAR